jgi:hypothetical protein
LILICSGALIRDEQLEANTTLFIIGNLKNDIYKSKDIKNKTYLDYKSKPCKVAIVATLALGL